MGLARVLGDHVHDSVDRVRPPERPPRSPDDLDPLDVLEEDVLLLPEDAGEEWGVDQV